MALLLPGPRDDGGWNQAGAQALQVLEQSLGAETTLADDVAEPAFESTLRRFAEQRYDFVVGLGSQFAPAAQAVAARYPRVQFAVLGSFAGNNANLGALDWRVAQLGYLAGAAAALQSRTHKLGYIGGVAFANMRESADGFIAGARAIDPSAQVEVAWLGSWNDTARARSLAVVMIGRGVDVLLANCNAASRTIFDVAAQSHVYAIGWSRDQYDQAPGTVLTSGVLQIPELLAYGANLVAQGRWEGKHYALGLRQGVQMLSPSRGLLSIEQERRLEDLRMRLLGDEVELPPAQP